MDVPPDNILIALLADVPCVCIHCGRDRIPMGDLRKHMSSNCSAAMIAWLKDGHNLDQMTTASSAFCKQAFASIWLLLIWKQECDCKASLNVMGQYGRDSPCFSDWMCAYDWLAQILFRWLLSMGHYHGSIACGVKGGQSLGGVGLFCGWGPVSANTTGDKLRCFWTCTRIVHVSLLFGWLQCWCVNDVKVVVKL